MLGINCLLNNPEMLPKLAKVIEFTANSMVENTPEDEIPEATLPSVYNALRRAGLEIDLQTTANLYRDVLDLEDPTFSSSEEIEQILLNDIVKRVNVKSQQIIQLGKNAPANEVALKIIDTIQKILKIPAVKTVQVQMQDRLMKVARKVLSESKEGKEILQKNNDSKDVYEILKDALLLEKEDNIFGDFGYLNTAKNLFEDFQKEIEDMADSMVLLDAYSSEQIKMAANVIKNSAYQLMLSKAESRKVLNKALEDSGFTKVNNNGGVTVDWNSVISIKGRDVMFSIKKTLSEKGFSEDELNSIIPALESEYNFHLAARIENQLLDKGMDHGTLGRLSNLAANNPGAWENAENNELLKGLGIPMADRDAIKIIQNVMQMYNTIIQGFPMASYATTYINTIERHIRNMIERGVENSDNTSNWLKTARWFQLSSQFAQSAILSNPGNVAENTLSGIATVLDAMVSNPQHFGKLLKAGAMSGLSVATGGVRVGRENTNPNSHNVNLEDRTSAHYGKDWKWLSNQWQRLSLSASDSMFGQYLMSSVELRMVRFLLKTKAGLSNQEANKVINDLYYNNSNELDQMAEFLLSELDKLGIKYNRKAEKSRIINEMYLSNLISDGQVWQDTLDSYKASGKAAELNLADKLSSNPIRHDLLLKIRNAADAVRGKAMGHRSDTLLGSAIERLYDFGVEKRVEEAKQSGNQRKQGFMEFIRGGMANTLFARRGSLNWAFLIMQRSTGLGLVSTLIHDILMTKLGYNLGGKQFLTKSHARELYSEMDSAKSRDELNESISKFVQHLEYNESVRQRLVRSTLGTLFTVSIAIAIWSQMKSDCDESDPECLQKRFDEWNKRGYMRGYQQMLPYILNGFIDDQFDKFGKIKPEKDRSKSPAEYLAKTFPILGSKSSTELWETYSRYADKNKIFDDNLFGTLYHMLTPPAYIQEYDYPEYRSAAIGQLVTSFTGTRHLKVVDVWGDRVKAYGFALNLYDPGMSAQEQKDRRKQLYPKGWDEGVLNQTLERNMYRWFLENYGHLAPDYKKELNIEVIGGIGPKKALQLANHGIYAVKDMQSMELEQLIGLKDEKGDAILTKRNAIAIYNELKGDKSYGGTDFVEIGFDNEDYKLAKELGYYSIGPSNLESFKNDLQLIYQTSQEDTKNRINSIFTKLEKVK